MNGVALAVVGVVSLASDGPGACDEGVSNAALAARVDVAESAWKALDLPGFRTETDVVLASVPCLTEPATPQLAARVHRLQGMRGFVQEDFARSEAAFAAARRTAPALGLPDDFAPARHPMRTHHSAQPVDLVDDVPLPPGTWVVDGRGSKVRATRVPTLVQRLEDAQVVRTQYAWPEEAILDDRAPAPERGGAGRWLALTGGVFAVAGGVTYATALGPLAEYEDPTTANADRPALRQTVNGRVVTAGVLGTLGVGLVGAGIVVPW